MDGKYVPILALENSGIMYYNYMWTFSIVLFAIEYAHYNAIYADMGHQGLISDGGAFKHTSFSKRMGGKKNQSTSTVS
jgi:hypothetical protein